MHARLIAYPPDQAAITSPLKAGDSLRIGRAGDNRLRIDHPSISRAHAELLAHDGSWTLHDLGSKNGSFVEGERVAECTLEKPCWLRFGDVYGEFTLLDDAEAIAEAGGRTEGRREGKEVEHTGRNG